MRYISSMSRGNTLAPNRHNSLSCIVRTSRQGSCNQRVGCLLCSIARFYDLWNETSTRCVGMVPCHGKDGYQAQVLQDPIDTCRFDTTENTTLYKALDFVLFLQVSGIYNDFISYININATMVSMV